VLNNLGKMLRAIRLQKEERLMDMAQKIEVSVAFLSAIETGRKEPPLSIVQKIASAYDMSKKQRIELELAVFNSRTTFKLEPQSAIAQDTVALLARRLNKLAPEDHKKIQAILHKDKSK